MAILQKSDGATRRREDAGHAGGVEDTRTRRIRKAQRHSRLVRVLRIALPAGALAIAGYYAFTLLAVSNFGADIARKTLPKIVPTSLTMKNPRYRGYTKDGGAYFVTAATARPHPKHAKYILLNKINGSLTQKAGSTLTLTAMLGTFNTEQENILLRHKVNLKTDRGGWARLKTLRYESRTGLITSDTPVEFGNSQARISGQRLKIMQKSKEMTVSGEVRAIITPPGSKQVAPAQTNVLAPQASDAIADKIAETATADPKTPPGSPALTRLFTGGKGPVEITSDRLELDDVKKTAIFIGKVRAKQGDVTLTTPELRIAYDGAPSGGLTGASGKASSTAKPAEKDDATTSDKSPTASAKINSIVAANPVAITQAPATHMTATSGAFDAASQRATLAGSVVITRAPDTRITGQSAGFDDKVGKAFIDGDVVMVQGADRRVTGRHAEFDEKSETALLTGNVVLTQGKNELRGQRLFIDQKAARTELTSPPMAGSGPGRITARFVQDETKSKRTAATTAGNTDLAGFRTTPGAPVEISANALEVLEAKQVAVFRGDVQARQGDFQFRTAELNAQYTGKAGISRVADASPDAKAAEGATEPAASLKRLQARGKVVVTSRNGQKATGDWADFDVAANTVTMGGSVVLTQGRNVVKGTRLVIDMTTGESVINTDNSAAPRIAGEKPGGGWRAYEKPDRPRAVFFPRDAKESGSAQANKPKSTATSGWQSTTAPASGGN